MTTPDFTFEFDFDFIMPMQWVMEGDKNRTGGAQAMTITHGKRDVDTDTRIRVMPGSYIIQWDSLFPDGVHYRSFWFRDAGGTKADDYYDFFTRSTSGSQRITIPVESDLICYLTLNDSYTNEKYGRYASQVISLIPVAPLASDVASN